LLIMLGTAQHHAQHAQHAQRRLACLARSARSESGGDAAARIFLPQLVDFDLNFLSQFLSDFSKFSIQKKARIFLFNIHQLPTRDIAGPWSGCAAKSAVAVSR
jgi:hypothetical protein